MKRERPKREEPATWLVRCKGFESRHYGLRQDCIDNFVAAINSGPNPNTINPREVTASREE